MGNLEIQDILINPQNTETIYVGTESGIYKSVNGGNDWFAINSGLPGGAVIQTLAINPVDTNIVFAGTYGDGLYKSDNGGSDWSASGTGISNAIINCIAINSESPGVLYVGVKDGDVYRSTNNGSSWTEMDHVGVGFVYEIGALRLNPLDQEIIYALFGYGTTAAMIYKRLEDLTLPASPEVAISHSGLSESNLNGAIINLSLSDITFSDASLDKQNFDLNNPPAGTSVNTVTYISSTEATISLSFNGTDFDVDVTNFSITVSSSELSGSLDLTSNEIAIVATVEPLSQENDILTYSFPEQAGNAIIDAIKHQIFVTLTYGTDPSSLTASFTISAKASIDIQGTPQVSGVIQNDFSSIVTYTVVAENGTSQNWDVIVEVASIIFIFPYFEDFENGTGSWYAEGTNSTWECGTPNGTVINSAYSEHVAWVTSFATYNPNEISFAYSPPFDFTNLSDPVVEMKVWWDMEGMYDGTCFQYSVDTGKIWITVLKNTDYIWYNRSDLITLYNAVGSFKGWSGDGTFGEGSNGWVTANAPLTGLTGNPYVQFRFAFASNGSVENDGFAFDDVKIYSDPAAGVESIKDNNNLKIYPNPFNDKTIIEFQNPSSEPFRLTLTDLSGKVVRIVDNITDSIYELDREGLSKGFYFIELRGGNLYRGKILIE